MIRKKISTKRTCLLAIGTMIVLCLLYLWMSARQKAFNPKDTTLPNIPQFVEGIKTLTHADANGHVWIIEDLRATYTRHLSGMACGIALALTFGLLMGCFTSFEAAFKFPVACLAKIPPTAMIAVYFVLFGTDFEMYVAMIALGIFPVLTQTIYHAAQKDVRRDAIYKAYTLGATDAEVIWNVVLQQILPRFIEAIRMTVGPAMVFLIAAEWMMSDVGIGYRLRIQSRLLNMNIVYIYLAILCFTTYIMDWSLSILRQKLCPWFGE